MHANIVLNLHHTEFGRLNFLVKQRLFGQRFISKNARQIINGLHGFIYTFTGLKPKPNTEIIKEGNWL